eukprot:TRINITY_DN5628_c0_g1_i1.p1 TRINITY_DN5628_c0_g1~~TRINITY_DN5628_c0_g1_i1.p1  ORF type:complete len:139 (-),score=26.73 TRINITY_DN5628_c0_g1_i1:88-504(-)
MKPVGLCQVCSSAESIYKCPNCRLPYCSVSCFKSHKEKCIHEEKQPESNAVQEPTSIDFSETGGGILTEDDLKNLAHSPDLIDHLQTDQELQKFIRLIVAEDTPEKQMRLMDGLITEYPQFTHLCDEILDILEKTTKT